MFTLIAILFIGVGFDDNDNESEGDVLDELDGEEANIDVTLHPYHLEHIGLDSGHDHAEKYKGDDVFGVQSNSNLGKNGGDDSDAESEEDESLLWSGRLFGGLVKDVKRKIPWIKSDFTDALSPQTFASIIYIYLATVTKAITFGGFLGDITD